MLRFGFDIRKGLYHAVAGVVLLLCLSGCNKDPEDNPAPKGKTIEFFAKTDGYQTKAGGSLIEDGTFPNDRSFGVYAYQIGFNGTDVVEVFKNPSNVSSVAFDNKEVTKSNDAVSYSPKVFWPQLGTGKSLRFFAYYPWTDQTAPGRAISVSQTAAQEEVNITFTQSGDPSEQIDLMHWMGTRNTTDADVNIELGHSLARLKFQAMMTGFPTGTQMRVTQIEVLNAVTSGTLNVKPGTGNTINSVWNLNSAVKTPMVMTTSNGLNGSRYLTDAYASVLDSDAADMLVIPQSTTGVTLKITTEIDGITKVYTQDLTGMKDWIMNESVTYRFTFGWDGISLQAVVADWNGVPTNVIFDRQYYLKTTQTSVGFGVDGGTTILTFETNYDGSHGSFPGRLVLTNPTDSWCTVSMGNNIGGTGTDRREFAVTAGPNAGDRNTSFTVSAGNMRYVVKVAQGAGSDWMIIQPSSTSGFELGGKQHYIDISPGVGWNSATDTWSMTYDDPNQILLIGTDWNVTSGNGSARYIFYFKAGVSVGDSATISFSSTGRPNKVFTITTI